MKKQGQGQIMIFFPLPIVEGDKADETTHNEHGDDFGRSNGAGPKEDQGTEQIGEWANQKAIDEG